MKGLKWFGVAVVVFVAAFAFKMALDTGEKSPIIAAGELAISDDLKADASVIPTLFIIVHDQESPMPMPFGAQREKVPTDLSKPIEFTLTKEALRMMNPDAPFPKLMRIKARLDKDGIAGPDQPGDLVGEITQVPFGSTGIVVKIDKKVE